MHTGTQSFELPFHLRGNYAPVQQEVTALQLPVQGRIPPALQGRYFRNGPNPHHGVSPHWFFGDGMVHGVELHAGQARWYRNRYVRTRTYLEEARHVGEDGSRDYTVGVANTHVIAHAGRILALVETSLPMELTPELDTIGCYNFGGRLRTAMTAHPKICPQTGELHFFAYNFMPPFLVYHRADAQGRLVESRDIAVSGPTMMHDFAITAGHIIFMDLPVVFDFALAQAGTMPYRWSDTYGARLGIMPRDTSAVRWVPIAPCYVFHPLNAFEEAGEIIMDVVRYERLWQRDEPHVGPAHLHRWRIDLATGNVQEQPLDDRAIEFPRCDERRVGLPHRYGYAMDTGRGADENSSTRLLKYDVQCGTTVEHDFGPGRIPNEAVFVPASSSAGEDEGWLLTYVYDANRDGSDLVILDAQNFPAPAVATVALPQRVPFGFHGSWIADAEEAQR